MRTSLRALRSSASTLLSSAPWRSPHCHYATSSSNQWVTRQTNDKYTKESKAKGYRSRAVFKLAQMDIEAGIFKKKQTVLDLGYAPGSWAQYAITRIQPGGRLLGVDIIPALPPKDCCSIQGNFLMPAIRQQVKDFLADTERGRTKGPVVSETTGEVESYIDAALGEEAREDAVDEAGGRKRTVDVVLSDMCEPFPQLADERFKPHLNDPWFRLMNTTGIPIRDHSLSMDLCDTALEFALEVLKPNGHFVCKFYTGAHDKKLEMKLKKTFSKVKRVKPEASRSESKESYFVALRLKKGVGPETIAGMPSE